MAVTIAEKTTNVTATEEMITDAFRMLGKPQKVTDKEAGCLECCIHIVLKESLVESESGVETAAHAERIPGSLRSKIVTFLESRQHQSFPGLRRKRTGLLLRDPKLFSIDEKKKVSFGNQ